MINNAFVSKNSSHDFTKDFIFDSKLSTFAISLNSNEERNRTNQQRRVAKSSKTINENAISNDARKIEASKQSDAFFNQEITRLIKQRVTSININ